MVVRVADNPDYGRHLCPAGGRYSSKNSCINGTNTSTKLEVNGTYYYRYEQHLP